MKTLIPISIRFRTILVPSDFGDSAQCALAYATAIADKSSSKILLTHVNLVTNTTSPSTTWITQELWKRATERLEEIGAEIRSLGFHAHTISLTGSVEEEVLGLANRENADLIVLGTEANRGIERLLAGSDAEVLIRKATCPVLVIGPGVLPPTSETWSPKSVTCATDLSLNSAPIVAAASSLAEQYHAALTLLHIEEISRKSRANQISEFANALGDLLPHVPAMLENLQIRLSDSPGYAIVDFAMEQKTDLLVMSVHSAPAHITHFFRGTAPHVFAKAPCPVLILHAGGD